MTANTGDAARLAVHPASTRSGQFSEAKQCAACVTPKSARLAIGHEQVDHILQEPDAAFAVLAAAE